MTAIIGECSYCGMTHNLFEACQEHKNEILKALGGPESLGPFWYQTMDYNLTQTHYRDIYGHLLWIEPIQEEFRLCQIGDEFAEGDQRYRVARVAVVENIQHVNVEPIIEDVNITEPYL